MSDLDNIIVKYFEKQGYDGAARALRREASCGKGNNDTKYSLDTVFGFYRENPDCIPKPKRSLNDSDDFSSLNKKHKANDAPAVPTAGESERIFLGNLSFKVNDEAIKKFFAFCGEIVDINYVLDKVTGKFYGTAFVTFDSLESAHKAMAMNGKKLLERPIKMNFAPHRVPPKNPGQIKVMPPAPKPYDRPPGCRTLFLGNLAFEVTEEAIREFFAKCGPIYEVRFQIRENGDFKGCGFVEFEHETSINDALKLHAKPLVGRPVRIDFA